MENEPKGLRECLWENIRDTLTTAGRMHSGDSGAPFYRAVDECRDAYVARKVGATDVAATHFEKAVTELMDLAVLPGGKTRSDALTPQEDITVAYCHGVSFWIRALAASHAFMVQELLARADEWFIRLSDMLDRERKAYGDDED